MTRRRRHPLLGTSALAATLVATAVPAFAHATFDEKSVPIDSAVTLRMRVPLERPGFTNRRVEALLPAPFDVTSCGVPSSTWSCEIDTTSQAPDTLVTWTALPAGTSNDIRFDLGLRTPGRSDAREYLIPVIQTYSDGEESRWTHEDGNEPAPRLTVVAPPTSGSGTSQPAPSPAPSTRPSAPPASTLGPSRGEDAPATPASPTPPTDEPSPAPAEPSGPDSASQTNESPDDDRDAPAVEAVLPDEEETATSDPEIDATEGVALPAGQEDDDDRLVVPVAVAAVLVTGTGTLAARELRRRKA